jgi:fibronectin type 3 domain-containing protein
MKPSTKQSRPSSPPARLVQKAGLFLLALSLAVTGCDAIGGGDEDVDEEVIAGAPANLTAESGNSEVALTWDAATDATTYSVYRSTDPTAIISGDPVSSDVSETNYTDTSVSNGITYYYKVTAVADVEGEPSNGVEVTPFSEPPTTRP